MSQEEESLSIFEEEGRNENRPRQNHQWLHPLKTAARNTHIEPGYTPFTANTSVRLVLVKEFNILKFTQHLINSSRWWARAPGKAQRLLKVFVYTQI